MQEEEYNCRGCSSSRRAIGTGWRMSSVQCYSLGCVNRDRHSRAAAGTGLHRKPECGVQEGPQRSQGRAGRRTETGKEALGLAEPAHVAMPSWDWWPQSRPAAAGSATQAAFGWSVPRVTHERIRDNLTARVRWTRSRQIPSVRAGRSRE